MLEGSILVIDNASIYYVVEVYIVIATTRYKLKFLLLYSLDFNPIKLFFTILKV